MSKEIHLPIVSTPTTAYFVICNSVGEFWNTALVAFEAYNAANWTSYDVALTRSGSSIHYFGDFPTSIAIGTYSLTAYEQAGASPAITDSLLGTDTAYYWSGTATVFAGDVLQINGSSTAAARLSQMFAATRLITVDDATFSPTTTAFETDQTTDDSVRYGEQVLFGLDGSNTGVTTRIVGYAFTNSKVKLTVDALPVAPSDGHRFLLMGRIEQ